MSTRGPTHISTRSSSRLGRAAAVVAAMAAGPMLLVSPAQAATHAWNDRSGDMHLFDYKRERFVPAPNQTNGDVIRSSIRHTSKAIIIRQNFTALDRNGESLGLFMGIETSAGRFFWVGVDAAKGRWGGETALFNQRDQQVRCNISHKLDYAADTLYLKVPRSCLKDPRWIRAHLFTQLIVDNNTRHGAVYLDDAHSGNIDFERMTPRIRRG